MLQVEQKNSPSGAEFALEGQDTLGRTVLRKFVDAHSFEHVEISYDIMNHDIFLEFIGITCISIVIFALQDLVSLYAKARRFTTI